MLKEGSGDFLGLIFSEFGIALKDGTTMTHHSVNE